ncbi:acyl carrier protein [Iamia majanohamensis]|uniref:Acyl carrier protein n=1 Tax=Iamia majanohamensis TaxID=467976 RepID=A0AAE9YAC8_9ACTN|nr:acyl carrier protein [Iamia majanohamensis]WCO67334.1 acyl carrier protein [Iamia majanohamensis]
MSVTDAEILEFIQAQAHEILDADPAEVTPEVSLAKDFDADSIDVIEMASAAERRWDITIEDHEVYDLTCVGDFVHLIAGKVAASG